VFLRLLICSPSPGRRKPALAQAIIRGDEIPAGEVVDNDVILSGDVRLHLAGEVNGNAFVAGREVVIDGHVTGSVFAIAQRITINGAVVGGAYTLGLVAQLGEAQIGRTSTSSASAWPRPAGLNRPRPCRPQPGGTPAGGVARNTRLIAGLVQFLNLFMDNSLGPADGRGPTVRPRPRPGPGGTGR
jgi:hypothetical protein